MLCPYCNEEIKDGAKKCKHCGEFLDESLKEEKTKVVEKVVESKTVKDYSFYSEIKYQARQKINCPACGFSGIASSERKYSGFVFLILLFLGIFPGIIYYLCCPKVCKCPKCGNNKLSNDGKETFMEEGKRQLKTGCLRFLGIILFFVIVGIFSDDGNGSTTSTPTPKPVEKTNEEKFIEEKTPIFEGYGEAFKEISCLDNCKDNIVGFIFNSMPEDGTSDPISSITRGQAVNYSKEFKGVGSVKTRVGGKAVMFCIATNGQIKSCEDYR